MLQGKQLVFVFSELYETNTHMLFGQSAQFFSVKAGGTYSYHCTLTKEPG
jgi:hypothetical protein